MISPAKPTDLPAILALEAAGFSAAQRWSSASWLAELTGTDRHVLVARESDGVVGVGTFQLVAGIADLHRVVVAPDQRGRAIGQALIEAGLAWVAERGGVELLLEVAADNAPALALYRRMGFAAVARRDHYYGVGRAALVLRLEILERESRSA